jgi:hypothetical protein
MNEELIIDIWETFKDYIPEKTRETAASQFLDFLVGQDVDTETIEGLKGYDPHLDEAIDLVLKDQDDSDEDFDEEDEKWDDEEDY